MHADWKWTGARGELTLDATRVLRVSDEVPGQWRIDICVGDAFLCDVVAGSREDAVEAVEKAAGVYVEPCASCRRQVSRRADSDVCPDCEEAGFTHPPYTDPPQATDGVHLSGPTVGAQTLVLDPPQTPLQAGEKNWPTRKIRMYQVLALIERVRKAKADRDHARGVAFRFWMGDQTGADEEHAASWEQHAAAQAPTGAETDDGEA